MSIDNPYNIWILEQVRLCDFWFWGHWDVDTTWILSEIVEDGSINAKFDTTLVLHNTNNIG